MATETPDEFVNRTQGWVGIMRINRKGDEIADTVAPGDRVFLTAEEQLLTARPHRRREDSPFHPREISHFDPLTGEVVDTFIAPLLEKVTEPEPEPAVAPAEERPPRRRRTGTAVAT